MYHNLKLLQAGTAYYKVLNNLIVQTDKVLLINLQGVVSKLGTHHGQLAT